MAKNPSVVRFAWTGARLLLGGLFVFSGIVKTLDPAGFAVAVDHYRLLPEFAVGVMAVYLPWLEIACGGAVLVRRGFRGALLLLTILCGIFCLALTSAWLRGLDIECGCFGQVAATGPLAGIARSLGLGLVAFGLLRRERRRDAGSRQKP